MTDQGRRPKARKRVLQLLTAEQKNAIRSPLRQQLLELLDLKGPSSVADLATRMGRPSDRLYYHVRLMLKAGIIRPSGSRKAGKRDEVLYEPAADLVEWVTDGEPSDAADVIATLRPALRRSEKELGEALSKYGGDQKELERNVYGGRMRAHLSPSQISEVRRHIEAIQRVFKGSCAKDPGPKDRPFAVSVVFAPSSSP